MRTPQRAAALQSESIADAIMGGRPRSARCGWCADVQAVMGEVIPALSITTCASRREPPFVENQRKSGDILSRHSPGIRSHGATGPEAPGPQMRLRMNTLASMWIASAWARRRYPGGRARAAGPAERRAFVSFGRMAKRSAAVRVISFCAAGGQAGRQRSIQADKPQRAASVTNRAQQFVAKRISERSSGLPENRRRGEPVDLRVALNTNGTISSHAPNITSTTRGHMISGSPRRQLPPLDGSRPRTPSRESNDHACAATRAADT